MIACYMTIILRMYFHHFYQQKKKTCDTLSGAAGLQLGLLAITAIIATLPLLRHWRQRFASTPILENCIQIDESHHIVQIFYYFI